jgi:hypothetical protein
VFIEDCKDSVGRIGARVFVIEFFRLVHKIIGQWIRHRSELLPLQNAEKLEQIDALLSGW